MVFDQNTLADHWRAQVCHCVENGIAIDRDTAFALAVADLLELPDEMPLAGCHGRYVHTDLPSRSGKSRSAESSSTRRRPVAVARKRQLVALLLAQRR
jgi:hypothetical protein